MSRLLRPGAPLGQCRAARVLRRGLAQLKYAGDALVSAVLAPHCASCARILDTPLDGPVCPACWAAIRPLQPPLCLNCGDALPSWRVISVAMSVCARCRRSRSAVDRSRCGGEYDGVLRKVIHAFKYEGRRSLAVPLAGIMLQAGGDLLREADAIVPVPLHPLRRLRRGFNQASDLARRLDRPVVQALWRIRATSPQAGLTAAARRRNMRRAFRLSPLLPGRTRALIEGRVVVLIDDVSTTGATLDACARVLKEAGAREVRALTAARALRRTAARKQS